MLQYIDTHAHLFYDEYKDEFDQMLIRAKDSGVLYCVVPGTDVSSSRAAVKLAEHYESIYACVGIHPHDAQKASEQDFKEIEHLAQQPKVVALGEIGLDYHYEFSPRDIQREVFLRQLQIAARRNLPVVIHTRESKNDAMQIVRQVLNDFPDWKRSENTPQRGVFHCFPGTAEEAKELAVLGFYVSYTGIVTFKKSESIEEVKKIGVQNILLETDSPYMTPVPFRGKRNEPGNIHLIGKTIATACNLTEEEVARITTENAMRLFYIPHTK